MKKKKALKRVRKNDRARKWGTHVKQTRRGENTSERSRARVGAEEWDVSGASLAMMNRRYIRSFCERWLQCQITDSPLLITKHTGLDYGARLTAVISPGQKCHRIIIFTHSGAICSMIVYLCLWCVRKLASGNNFSLSLTHTQPLQICAPPSLPLLAPITEKTENGFGIKHINWWRTDEASLFRCKNFFF